jgi:cellulose synthase/poly-beta-1,6-N-acetylglucosamine synthase-like glycosyltransferase
LPKGEPGYAWRGELDQEFSAVTGACLLVRRDIFNAVGGLNEAYATGFNDVDFCLRVRELGYAVVFAGSVEMIHHETVTFGHHYAGDPEREASDIQRMRARWGDVVSCDPFHNPNLSLVAGSEWMPSFPPRG